MARILVYFVGLLLSLATMSQVQADGGAFAVASGFAIGFAIPLIDTVLILLGQFRTVWYSLRTWRTHVRISASYLYRIRVDNDYLLVKGKRFDQYQPVGGVYKAHVSSFGRRQELRVLDDDLLVPDEVSEDDLRVRVPGKNLMAFLRWFEEGRGREVDGWREFYEELVATGIVPEHSFRFIRYDVIRRYKHPLRYSPWAKSKELLIADVLELLPTPDQLEHLRALKSLPDPRYLWATEEQIRRRGATSGSAEQTIHIAQNAEWTI
jgi:hypothetical protein